MNEKISRLYEEKTQEELAAITYGEAFKLFANDELEVLATRHWMFDVNVPVVVSVMRNTKQEIVPFWLISDAFTKTKMTLNNEMTTYEVWQSRLTQEWLAWGSMVLRIIRCTTLFPWHRKIKLTN